MGVHACALYWHCVCKQSSVCVFVCVFVCVCVSACMHVHLVHVFVMLCMKIIFVCFACLYTIDLYNYGYLHTACFSLNCKVL